MNFKDKVVIITGSSIGIGRETAYKFAEQGAKVIVTYYEDEEEAGKTAKKCEELGASEVLILHLNVMDSGVIEHVVNEVILNFGKIDVLVNNAGVIAWEKLKDQSEIEIMSQIRTNLEGLIMMTKKCLPHIKETIINVSSGAGKTGYSDLTVYCATKFGVRGFTQALATELSEKIKIYSVNPGSTKTRMTNFSGVEPGEVAKIILQTAKDGYGKESGEDIDVWEFL